MRGYDLVAAAGVWLLIPFLLWGAGWAAPPPDVFYVSPTGIDSTFRDGSALLPWRSIGYAIGRASVGSGDVIMVLGDADDNNDDYVENVTVSKSVHIRSDPASLAPPTVRALNGSYSVFDVTSSNVEIKGLRIYGSGSRAGIMLNSSNCLIEGNTLGLGPTKRNDFGIWVEGGSENIVQHNDAKYNNDGIYLCNTSANLVHHNTVEWNKSGIDMRGTVTANLVSGNNIRFNTDGDDGVGLAMWYYDPSNQNIVSGNSIEDNDIGLSLKGQPRGIMTSNNLLGNGIGLRASPYGGGLDMFLNRFENTANIISTDYFFLHYSMPLFYEFSGRYFKGELGNFYSDYTGSDSNGDGIGDAPHSSVSYEDDYPLMSLVTLHGWNLGLSEGGEVTLNDDDMGGPGKVLTLPAHSSMVFSTPRPFDEFPVLFAGGSTAVQTTWNGWLTFASAPAAGHTVATTFGTSAGSSMSFQPSGASANVAGDGVAHIIPFAASPGYFLLNKGEHLAVRLENTGDAGVQLMVGGAACMFFAPAGSRPGGPPLPLLLLLE